MKFLPGRDDDDGDGEMVMAVDEELRKLN